MATTYAPTQSDASNFQKLVENLPPAELRVLLKKKAESIEDPMLQAFQYMESEISLIDIMDELSLDFEKALDYQTKYNQMKTLEQERLQISEPFLKAWFDCASVMGVNVRRECRHYNEVTGVCQSWKMADMTKKYRDTYRGLFRSTRKKGGGFFLNVEHHSEMCAVCIVGYIEMSMKGGLSEGNN